MSDNNQNSEFDDQLLGDELLSAYVDGELSDEELAQVERRLADDPRARQLVEELRALGQAVQALPKEFVGEDLRATVMQRAERAMLLGGEVPTNLPRQASPVSRRWLWAATALAATLLLSIYLPNAQQEEKPIASAKPVPGEPPRGAMRMEAVQPPAEPAAESNTVEIDAATLEDKVADEGLAAFEPKDQDMPGGGKLLAKSAPQASSAEVQSRTGAAPESAPLSVQAATSSAGLGGEAKFDGSQITCEVHITLGDGANSIEQFDRVLQRNGIVLQDRSKTETATDEIKLADSAELGQPVAQQQALRQGTEQTAKRRQAAPTDAQLVLVEAPLENVEQALAECNLDVFNCPTIRVVDDSSATTQPVARLRHWERSANEPAVEERANTLAERQASGAQSSATNPGRATRVETKQLATNELGKLKAGRRAMESSRNSSPMVAADKLPVSVLFVLQPAADLRKPMRVETEAESPTER